MAIFFRSTPLSGGIRTAAPRSEEPNVLLDAFIGGLARSSRRSPWVRQFQVVSSERDDRPLLVGSDPAWPSAALHFLDDDLVDYRVGPEIRDASLNDGLVFVGGSLRPVIGSKFWQIGTRINECKAAICVEYHYIIRIRTIRLGPAAIRHYGDSRDRLPGSDEILGRLRECAAWHERHPERRDCR